jgi:O-antigen/teichoic acid export membrane protein
MDTIMLGIMKTSEDVGIFKAASEIPLILPVILGASNSIYAPVVASLHHKGEYDRLHNLFRITTRWVYSLALPLSLIIIFSTREIMSIFGKGFLEKGIPVLMIFTLAQFVNCVTGGVGFTLTMTGKQKLEFYNSLGLFLMNVMLNLILIPRFGSMGPRWQRQLLLF